MTLFPVSKIVSAFFKKISFPGFEKSFRSGYDTGLKQMGTGLYMTF